MSKNHFASIYFLFLLTFSYTEELTPLDLNSLEKFLILPHHLPKVLNTAGKSFGPTKMIINAAMTRYSTPPIPGNITIT